MQCVQRSWTTLAGVSPVTVIASEPCSQTRCVAVMQGAKRVGKVTSKEVRAIMQTATLSEFCRIVKKRSLKREQREVEPCAYGRRPWNVGRYWEAPRRNPSVYRKRYV